MAKRMKSRKSKWCMVNSEFCENGEVIESEGVREEVITRSRI